MIELPEAFDPYLIPGTKILRNLVGAATAAKLEAAENDFASVRMLELTANPPKAQGTRGTSVGNRRGTAQATHYPFHAMVLAKEETEIYTIIDK